MRSRIILLVIIGLTVVLLSSTRTTAAQSDSDSCTSTIISMAPCLNFVTGSSSSPSSQCCSQLSKVVQSSPRCLCLILDVDGGASSLGVTVNRTLALALPDACNVKTPPVTQCNKGKVFDHHHHGPSSSPAAGSPLPSENDATGSAAGSTSINGHVVMNKFVLFLVIITWIISAGAAAS